MEASFTGARVQPTAEILSAPHRRRIGFCATIQFLINLVCFLPSAYFLTWAARGSSNGLGVFVALIFSSLGQFIMLSGRYQTLFYCGVVQGAKLLLAHVLAGTLIGTGFSLTHDKPGKHCQAVCFLASWAASVVLAILHIYHRGFDIMLQDYHRAIVSDETVDYQACLWPSWLEKKSGVPLPVHVQKLFWEAIQWYLRTLISKYKFINFTPS